MAPYLISALVYALGLPFLTWLVCFAHKRLFITKKLQNMPRSRQAQANLPTPLWPRLKEKISFALKDTRPFSLNQKKPKSEGASSKGVLRGMWLSGLGLAVAAPAVGDWRLLGLSVLPYVLFLIFSVIIATPILKARKQLYQKMFEVGQGTLGLGSEFAENPQAAIEVLEWRDILTPSKIRFVVPTKFNADSEENFQRQFNQVFGQESTWVPFNDPESGTPGWNYKEGFVTLKETPPLPTMAPWDEHYVLDPSVAWSFFPIALGVEGGIELENPKTGEVENVLGFDLSGEQASLSKKLGKYCSPTITTSPMVLTAGGTGGGKALEIGTVVSKVILEETYNASEENPRA